MSSNPEEFNEAKVREQNKTSMLGLLEHLKREIESDRVGAVSYILVPAGQLVPQHAFVANPNMAAGLIAGFAVAQAELVEFVRSPAPPASNPEADPNQGNLDL